MKINLLPAQQVEGWQRWRVADGAGRGCPAGAAAGTALRLVHQDE
ncbi:Uncharacterised protein [Vibrio cholerae]|nr:Uncharacterised protein [Vibrio cholerae]